MSTSLRSNPMSMPMGVKTTLFGLLLLSFSCRKEAVIIGQEFRPPVEDSEQHLASFYFLPDINSPFLKDTVTLEINGNEITGRIPIYTNLKSLVPTFETRATKVIVDGQAQESGNTPQDFQKPVIYRTEDINGLSKQYTVKITNFTGLPVIKLATKDGAVIDSKDNYVDAQISIDGAGFYNEFEGTMKIKGRGNSTWGFPKKPYKMKFDKKVSLVGEGEDKEWVLLANYTDNSQLRTSAAFFLGDISNLDWTPDAHYAEVFLNNVYQGTYQLCESVKLGENRVNLPKDGYLLEVDQEERLEVGDVFFKTSKMLVNIKEPEMVQNDPKYNYVTSYLADAENALFSDHFKDTLIGYAKYLDIPSFIDWYLINEISKNNDAIFYSSCYMNLTPKGKLKMGPIWDFDLAFGNTETNGNNSIEGFWVNKAPWIARLFEDPNFVKQVVTRFKYFKINENALLVNINTNASKLRWSAIENNSRWQTLYPGVWPNENVVVKYNNEVLKLKSWISARMEWLDKALLAL
ncbi:CotH kinase family protein [Flavitalea sp.]|nr:CotH kinase family protein [Flavitalea sp.]